MEEISKALKLIFLIHFIASFLLGVVFLLFTESFVALTGWDASPLIGLDPVAGRILGAAILGFAIGSLLAWRETEWQKVKIIVLVELTWLGVGLVTSVICAFIFYPSWVIWVIIGLFALFLVAFGYFYYLHESG